MGYAEKTSSVMVLSAAAGAGHLRAADALVSAFGSKGVSARHMEVLRYTNPIFRRFYSDLYKELVNRRPDLLGLVYDAMDRPWRFQRRRLALDRLNTGPLVRLLRQEKPSLALCTHFLPAEILVYLRRKNRLNVPVGIVVTDFDAHALWLYRNVDWYFVACEETRAYLSAVGIPPETIFVTGIPIDPVFGIERSKQKTRKRLGLDMNMTTILISAGGFGVESTESIVRAIHKIQYPIQIIVICGQNTKLQQRVSSILDGRHPMKVIGFTHEMDSWMAASDLLVGKAGGLTSSEALASGLILVIVNPIPGQEERNSDHFLEEGVAIRCNNLPALAHKIDNLLADKKRLLRMRQAVKRVARPHAASDIVSIVLESKHTIL